MRTIASVAALPKAELKPLTPMGILESILLFGIPAAALAASMLWLWPTLTAAGMPSGSAYSLSLTLVNGGLLIAALAGYAIEGNPLTWHSFSQRMRLTRMSGRTWLWMIAGTVFLLVLSGVVILIATYAYQALNFVPSERSVGYKPAWMTIVILFFNIVGEEIWWRGYILPRQELAFGKKAFLVHGILWPLFHIYRWYNVPFMFMTQWVIPFIAQRTKNTWPGLISHTCLNSASPIAEMILAAL